MKFLRPLLFCAAAATSCTGASSAEVASTQPSASSAWQEHAESVAVAGVDPSDHARLLQSALTEFYGNGTSSSHPTVRHNASLPLVELAASQGLARAQFLLGVAHATGFWGDVPNDAKAVVYLYFAAAGGDLAANMALGYKHMMGDGVPKNCDAALRYYEVVANRAIEVRENEDSLSPVLYDQRHKRLKTQADLQHKKNQPGDVDVVEYYHFSADKGDPEASLNLALLYYYGARGVTQDVKKAATYFHKAHDLGVTSAAANLGHIYANGIGVDVDLSKAFAYFQEAAHEGNAASQNGLATLYLNGRGAKENKVKAITLFRTAAKQGNADAFYNLGTLALQGALQIDGSPDFEAAYGYFQVAAQHGHTQSMHKVGHMAMHGIGVARSCRAALDAFKTVAERGYWEQELRHAYQSFSQGDYTTAFRTYVVLAEQGYEVAQHNAAWMLESQLGMPSSLGLGDGTIRLYKAAAAQGNVDANVKLGDFYYYGYGTSTTPSFAKAMAHYVAASTKHGQASYNLGYMYEHGVGTTQDFMLAKRYYDLSLDINPDGYVPVTLALHKLAWHQALLPFQHMTPTECVTSLVAVAHRKAWAQWKRVGGWIVGSGAFVLSFVSGMDMVSLLVQADVVPETDTLVIAILAVLLGFVWTLRLRRR
ncbi:hypothetical protein H257_05618 [Aphanomyces astaci]|uniref:Uncharacterized protein n=1 Tax=Aphanomyces astaci TaxID=112090 RepID=W4GS19_APHAT|nr:hypothetical protein H257_05618 [Aphanomyces astaci]ETV82116.1 hypothetical protein H257_05618 [Aphanomyces astaci]RQM28564.1 hypothetical protein B5M09_007885 [Aphanomyces astaci]|eukprot:XP_009828853.1 hypothetical protein H257_05618 [Aphanomyces astaci]